MSGCFLPKISNRMARDVQHLTLDVKVGEMRACGVVRTSVQ